VERGECLYLLPGKAFFRVCFRLGRVHLKVLSCSERLSPVVGQKGGQVSKGKAWTASPSQGSVSFLGDAYKGKWG
jgi:hypothetical protein